jgi:hypothetical protein
LRELFISASVVGIILMSGNFLKNESFKSEMHLIYTLDVNSNFQQLLERNLKASTTFSGPFTFSLLIRESIYCGRKGGGFREYRTSLS